MTNRIAKYFDAPTAVAACDCIDWAYEAAMGPMVRGHHPHCPEVLPAPKAEPLYVLLATSPCPGCRDGGHEITVLGKYRKGWDAISELDGLAKHPADLVQGYGLYEARALIVIDPQGVEIWRHEFPCPKEEAAKREPRGFWRRLLKWWR